MTGCFPLFCIGNIKHANLVNSCYPVKQSSNQPRSSDLSYLTFYASSKPAKLTKVGTYLEKKVVRDIRKGRNIDNQVSLHILKALIQACHRDLNIFSKYVVQILLKILDTKDIELINLSCETFIVFCSYHEGSTLGVDSEFTNYYEDLLKKWVDLCIYNNQQDNSVQLQMRYIGHRAVQAAVTSGALQSSDFKVQSSILFPPLISTLASSNQALENSDTGGQMNIRESTLNNCEVNIEKIEQVVRDTISVLFSKATGPFVRQLFSLLFGYVDDKKAWWPPHLLNTIIKMILDSLQPQYRYLLVSDILNQIDDSNSDSKDKNAALITVLDMIINSNVPLAGISVLEVLNALFSLLIRSHGNEDISGKLVHSIGGLVSQTYYDNQLNDVTSYLVSKLRVNTSLENVDGIEIHAYRIIVLNCLESVIDNTTNKISQQQQEETNSLDNDSFIPLNAWTPALGLLCDKNKLTRIAFCLTFSYFLQNMKIKSTVIRSDEFPVHNLSHHQDAQFIDRFFNTLLDWSQLVYFNKTDLQLLYSLLSSFTHKIGVDAIISSVPFVFKLQSLIKSDNINNDLEDEEEDENIEEVKERGERKDFEKQRGIESIILSWFNSVAQVYSIQPLQVYINLLQANNHLSQETESTNLSLASSNILLAEPEEFSHSERDGSEAIKYWIDRNEVVELMSKNGTMRDQNDTHGLELEAKLYTEWGLEYSVKNDQITRSRIMQEANEVKATLSNSWIQSSTYTAPTAGGNDHKKNNIRVSHLKESLVPQAIPDDEDSDSTQSIELPVRLKPRTDMNALLSELSVKNMEQSAVSLVKPPYTVE